MLKYFIFDYIFTILFVGIVFIVRYYNKHLKKMEDEKWNTKDIKNEISRNGKGVMYYSGKITECKIKLYPGSKKFQIILSGDIDVECKSNDPQKIIIFFDDIFQLYYKCNLYNFFNANKEQTRSIYRE